MKFSMQKNRRRFARRPWQMVLELLEDRTLLVAPAIIPIADQYAQVNTGFVLPVSAVDADDNPVGTDPVNLTARLADGGLLPGWLTFSAGFGTGTGTFTSTGTLGSIDVEVTATDSTGETDTDTFTIVATPAVGTLTAASPLANQTAGVHTPFSLSALGVFSDSTSDPITLSATQADGTELPAWLTFNPATGLFTGTPVDGDVGSTDVKLTGTTLSDQAAAIDPLLKDIWSRKAGVLLKLRGPEESLAAYDRAIQLKPTDLSVWEAKIQALVLLNAFYLLSIGAGS